MGGSGRRRAVQDAAGDTPVILAIDGLRPLGHRTTVPRLATAGIAWLAVLGALTALAVVEPWGTGAGGDPTWLPVATLGFVGSWLVGMTVTVSALHRPVPVRVTTSEVIVGAVRIPRAGLRLDRIDWTAGPESRVRAFSLATACGPEIRLVGVGRPYTRPEPGADVLVPAGLLEDLHTVLLGRTVPGRYSFPLLENASRLWNPDLWPMSAAVAALSVINFALPRPAALGIGIMIDLVLFSVAALWAAVRAALPRPATRRLIIQPTGIDLDNPYSRQRLACERWENLTVRRYRWRTQSSRYQPGVTMEALALVRVDGSRIIAIALPVPLRDRANRPPRIRRPRWIAQPESATALERQLLRRRR